MTDRFPVKNFWSISISTGFDVMFMQDLWKWAVKFWSDSQTAGDPATTKVTCDGSTSPISRAIGLVRPSERKRPRGMNR